MKFLTAFTWKDLHAKRELTIGVAILRECTTKVLTVQTSVTRKSHGCPSFRIAEILVVPFRIVTIGRVHSVFNDEPLYEIRTSFTDDNVPDTVGVVESCALSTTSAQQRSEVSSPSPSLRRLRVDSG